MEFDGTDKRDKAETGKNSRGAPPKGECNHHFFRMDGGLPGREIIKKFVAKQQSRGKTCGKSGVRVVTIVIIWEGVLEGLFPPPGLLTIL